MNQMLRKDKRMFSITRVIAVAWLIIAPIMYVRTSQIITPPNFEGADNTLLIMSILIPVGAILPLVWPLFRKVQIEKYKKKAEKPSVARMYLSMMTVRMSFVAAIYIYGFVAFFLTNEIINMSWFYLIGIVWSIIYWPRRSHFERVMNHGLEAM